MKTKEYHISLSSSATIDPFDFADTLDMGYLVVPEGYRGIGVGSFKGCHNLIGVVLPQSLQTLSDHAFAGCVSLTDIQLPAGLRGIGRHAFDDCISLAHVCIDEGVSYIEGDAFANCAALERIIIPASVTRIGAGAFRYCRRLTDVTISNPQCEIGEDAFAGTPYAGGYGEYSVREPLIMERDEYSQDEWHTLCRLCGLSHISQRIWVSVTAVKYFLDKAEEA